MVDEKLEEYLEEASEDLPTVPAVATKVIDCLDDPDGSLDDVRELIERDPALSARILKVSNSSMYGFSTEIQSLGQAISLVGGRAVRNLVMAVAMRETYAEFGDLEQMMWEHSMAAGPTALAVAAKLAPQLDGDEIFTAGLLHDIGKTALANSHRDEYEALSKTVFAGGAELVDAEREQFGFDHAALGGRVVEQWSLPDSAATVIANHHAEDLVELSRGDAATAAVVSITSGCLNKLGAGRPGPVEDLDVTSLPGWRFLKLGDDEVDAVVEICREGVESARAFGD